MLELKNITKTYKTKSGNVSALKNVSFTLPDTGMVFILGKSGSGKSTLLNMIGALDKFDSGDISINNRSFSSFNEQDFNSYRNEYVGFVFQDYNLLSDYDVEQNIELALDLQNAKNKTAEIKSILKKVGLEGYEKRRINELSGGQKQRISIARALIKNAKIILCDEPTGSLDSETGTEIFSLLQDLSKDYLIVVVSHDLGFAEKYSDRVIEIKDGEIVNDDIKSESASKNLEVKLKNYKLPLKRVFSLGFNFFKKKPIRLILAILISVISISMLSFSTTLSLNNKNEIVTQSLMKDNYKYLSFGKEMWTRYYIVDTPTGFTQIDMNDEDISIIKESTKINNFDMVYGYYRNEISNLYSTIEKNGIYLFNPQIKGFMELNQSIIDKYGYTLHGNLPKNDDEVVIPDYFYQMFVKYGYKNDEEEVAIDTYEDLFGKIFYAQDNRFGKKDLTIVGVLDVGFDMSRYREILTTSDKFKISILQSEIQSCLANSMHNIIYLSDGYHQRNISNFYENSIEVSNGKTVKVFLDDNTYDYATSLAKISSINADIYYNADNPSPDNGVILKLSNVCPDVEYNMSIYLDSYSQEHFEEIKEDFLRDYPSYKDWEDYKNYMLNNNYSDSVYTHITYEEIRKATIEKFIKDNGCFSEFNNAQIQNTDSSWTLYNSTVCAFYDDTDKSFLGTDGIYVTDTFYEYLIGEYGYRLYEYAFIVSPLLKNYRDNLKAVSIKDDTFYLEVPGFEPVNEIYCYTKYNIDNEYFASYEINEGALVTYKDIFRIISSLLIVLVVIFIYYYFSGMILEKKKEIGILRAMGSSKLDIMKIIFASDFILAIIIIGISCITSTVGTIVSNNIFEKNKFALLSMINISGYQYLIIIGVTLASVILAVIIPMIQILKKKPVDIINN